MVPLESRERRRRVKRRRSSVTPRMTAPAAVKQRRMKVAILGVGVGKRQGAPLMRKLPERGPLKRLACCFGTLQRGGSATSWKMRWVMACGRFPYAFNIVLSPSAP
jgi:phage tail tape-measure protein